MTQLIAIEREGHGVILENDRQLHAEGCKDIERFLSRKDWSITWEGTDYTQFANEFYGDLASDYVDADASDEYKTAAALNEADAYMQIKPCAAHIVAEQIKPYAGIEVEI